MSSDNEPGWGRQGGSPGNGNDPRPPSQRPPEGPPDLDELWRDLSRRLNALFGGNNGNGQGGDRGPRSPGGPSFNGRGLAVALGGTLVAAGLLWLGSGFFIVPEGQTAAVTRFGFFRYLTENAGFQWHWPYPIERHEMVDRSRLRQVEVGYRNNVKNKVAKESLILTGDQSIVDLQFAVQYRVTDPVKYLYENNPSPSPEELLRQAAESAMREVIGRAKIDQVLYEEKARVAEDAQKLTQGLLDWYNLGLTIVDLTVQQAQPPEQVQGAFEDANKAAQDCQRLVNEGEAYANEVVPRAEGSAERLRMDARGYRERQTAMAEGDASRFSQILTEYRKAPALTRDRLYLDTMTSIFRNTSTVMIDAQGGNNPMFYLPIDRMIAQGGARPGPESPDARAAASQPPASALTPPPSPSAPPGAQNPAPDPRSGMRSRDRDRDMTGR